MKKLIILGSTGSVGRNVLEVVNHHRDRFEVLGFAMGSNMELLREQVQLFPNAYFVVGNENVLEKINSSYGFKPEMCRGFGVEAIIAMIEESEADIVVNCMVGFLGLKPTVTALEKGIPVAIANKETVVTGGEFLVELALKHSARLIPIDSEHVAISQCLIGRSNDEVRRVFITASGGSLRDKPFDKLAEAKVAEVLNHPTWRMGNKITVDSATMLNKGLEVIEAHWLFGFSYDQIDVVIHPQSIVHAMVEFIDGSIMAQMSFPDMKLPILQALSSPERLDSDIAISEIHSFPSLSFSKVDPGRYPCLELTLKAAREGGNRPAVLSAADEEAVRLFLNGRIPFKRIHEVMDETLKRVPFENIDEIEDVIAADRKAREVVKERFDV